MGIRQSLTQKCVNGLYGLGADHFYRKFLKDTRKAGQVNREVLQDILKINSNTVYGELNHFAELTPDLFRKHVPLSSYSDYEKYIDEIAAGSEGVLTADPVTYFGLSSGTTGKQKRIPITPRTRKLVNMSMMFLQHGLLRQALPAARKSGRGLLLMNMLQSGSSSPGIQSGAGTSGGMESMKNVLPYFWTTPIEVLKLPDQQDANYLHLLFALQERNLAFIMAPFASGVVQLFATLEERYDELVEDISKGCISHKISLGSLTRESLQARLTPNSRRAHELKEASKNGFESIVPRVWPKINYVTCVSGGSFSIYVTKLRSYIGDLPLYSSIYAATEAMIGVAPLVNEASYVISPRAAYFEFIPEKESMSKDPSTCDLTEVQVGETYELVLTTYAGFYRYRLGDMVRIVRFFNESPVVEFLYRKGQLLNIAGEKTSESAVQQAMTKTMETLRESLVDYTVVLDLEDSLGCYKFYLEIAPRDKTAIINSEIQELLEKYLYQTNPRYRAGIQGKRILPSVVCLVKPGTFDSIRRELVKRGASLNQVKIPRLISDPELIKGLKSNCLKG